MKVISVVGLTHGKPCRSLQAKPCTQVHAESPTEINGKRAAASPGESHHPLLPALLPTCLLSTLTASVSASEHSTHTVLVTLLLAHSF
jgi:hypothetical protein